jgi:hypothetical protein
LGEVDQVEDGEQSEPQQSEYGRGASSLRVNEQDDRDHDSGQMSEQNRE